jgi:hypothetical protein
VSQPPFAGDPHGFDCNGCHRAPPGTPAADWRPTCTRSGCHPQAWTRTIFHRHGPEGTVIADRIDGAPIFPHDRHARIACDVCHRLDTRHADLTLVRAAQCDACHHGPPPAAACSACHPETEIAGARTRAARLQLQVWQTPRERRLPFDHARHTSAACETCHQASGGWTPADNCASCHVEHHRPEARCIDCHAQPPPRAHALDVHAGGCRECHGAASATEMQPRRNFCLACHQEQVPHMPGGNCADCHKLFPGNGAP